MIVVTGHTGLFNLSVVGENFINDGCFGEDISKWLVAALIASGVQADVICMEDFGWANHASYAGASYLLCVGGNADEEAGHPDQGQWRFMLERRRTLVDKIFGRNKISPSDALVRKLKQILQDGGFENVAVEP